MTAIQRATFTAASSDIDTYAVIGPARGVCRFWVSGSEAAGSPVIELALVDVDGGVETVLGRYPATCTVSARRADNAGTGGAYLCDAAFAAGYGGGDKFDLLGGVFESVSKRAEWRVGVTNLNSQVTVIVGWRTTNEV